MTKQTIVLDCDGVMVDYKPSYPIVYKKAFGNDLIKVHNRETYHAHVLYGLEDCIDDPDFAIPFFDKFTDEVWENLPAWPGAVEASHKLAEKYHLICVTSMNPKHTQARYNNLKNLGFPYMEVIAVGRNVSCIENMTTTKNPKAEILNSIKPAFFIDDLYRNFDDLDPSIKRVLLDSGQHDSPNKEFIAGGSFDYLYPSLYSFVYNHF